MKVSKITALWVGVLCMALPISVSATDKKEFFRVIKKEFLGMSSRTTMQLYNQYGKIDVHPANNMNADVSVRIAVFATSEAEAEKTFARIKINFDNTNTWAKAETAIESKSWTWSGDESSFKIDYDVSLPSVANLDLRNQYGHTTVADMSGSVKATVEYGNLNLGKMTGPLSVNIQYGNAEIVSSQDANIKAEYSNIEYKGSAANMDINAQYGSVKMLDANDLTIQSEYTNFTIGNTKNINASLQYGDFRVASVADLTIKSEYVDFWIGTLRNSLSYKGSYGEIIIDKLARDFTAININSEYTRLTMKLPEGAPFSYDVHGEYTDFTLPGGVKPANVTKNEMSKYWSGSVGSGGGKVTAKCMYGHVRIQ